MYSILCTPRLRSKKEKDFSLLPNLSPSGDSGLIIGRNQEIQAFKEKLKN